MKAYLFTAITMIIMFFMPNVNFGQAPDLGSFSSFALFTAAGAFNVLGASTIVTGDAGTNVGAFTGFPPGTIVGQIHVADAVTAQAAMDVALAYSYLSGMTCGLVLGTTLGNGQLLTPNIYCLGAASNLNGDLVLDGQNDPNALFIFQINGAFATSTLSKVVLINSASLCNVFWQINGEFTLGEGSVFRGNVVNNGAIHLLEGSSLFGRALSQAGAIDLHNNLVTIAFQPSASVIQAEGATTFCEGINVVLSGNNGGTWSNGATTPTITVTASGDYFVTNTNSCGSVISNHIFVTVEPLPIASIISAEGATTICEGENVILIGNNGGTWSNGVTTASITVTTSGDYFVTNTNNCGSVNSNHIIVTVGQAPTASVISAGGATTFCEGNNVVLSGNNGGTWSNGATTPTIIASATGDYFVTKTNSCGSVNSNHILVTSLPNPDLHTNPQVVCSPNKVDLTADAVTVGSTLYDAVLSYWLDANAIIPMEHPETANYGIYYIKATTGAGCYSITPVTVTINYPPIVFYGTGGGSYCEGGEGLPVGLSGSEIGVDYTITYVCGHCPALITVPGTGGPISFGLQTRDGFLYVFAENTITHCVNNMYNCISITVIPQLPVSVLIAPSANPVIADAAVTFTAIMENEGSSPSFQWKVNGLDVGSNDATYSYIPVNGDEVNLVLTSSAPCALGNPDTSNTVIVGVNGLSAVITATGIIVNGQSKCFSATQTLMVAGNGSIFTIQNGGSAVMVAGQNIRFLPGTSILAGGYLHGYIKNESNEYCAQKSPSLPQVMLGEVKPLSLLQSPSFTIYPNPTTGKFTLEQNGETSQENAKVEVYSMCGERVITAALTGTKQHDFWLSGFQDGLYFVKIVANDYQQTFKLVKRR